MNVPLAWQAPIPTLHVLPKLVKSSSMFPSQSLSTPSQTSKLSSLISEQLCVPAEHENTPSVQRSESAPSHKSPSHVSSLPSAVAALQSLSTPSQTSKMFEA